MQLDKASDMAPFNGDSSYSKEQDWQRETTSYIKNNNNNKLAGNTV